MILQSKFKPAYLVLLSSLLSLGCSSSNDLASLPRVVNGQTISLSSYPEVVLIGDKEGKHLCSGTFITSDAVLTAAHCTRNGSHVNSQTYRVGGLTLYLLKTDNTGSKSLSVVASSVAIYRNPWWDQASERNPLNKYDLALIKFPPNTSQYTHRLALHAPKRSDRLTIVGYGINYVPGMYERTIDRSSAGIKRAGTNEVVSTDNGVITFVGPTNTPTNDGNKAIASHGDSGGPMFVNDELVGVNSGGTIAQIPSFRFSMYVDLNSGASRRFLHHIMTTQ